MNWKTIQKISEETGMSQESLRALKKKGVLREKIHWIKAPNGRVLINIQALEKWLLTGV
uniref:MerR family transcriptional regulator n=1 Tax=Marinobacterium profundum TaxID=1714300 RepID=UPI000A670B59|nr:MerR family transcriptional regulator [Marinobacterium profundum]